MKLVSTAMFECEKCGKSVRDNKNARYYHATKSCGKQSERPSKTPKWKWGKVKCDHCSAVHGSSDKTLRKHL